MRAHVPVPRALFEDLHEVRDSLAVHHHEVLNEEALRFAFADGELPSVGVEQVDHLLVVYLETRSPDRVAHAAAPLLHRLINLARCARND